MSENYFQLFTTQFGTFLELKLQQKGSLLRGYTLEGHHVGKQAAPINQIAAIQAKQPAGRFVPKNRTDAVFTRRWVFPQDAELDQLIDSFDELRTIVDPKSQYSTNAAYAMGRAWDDAIIAAFFGTAFTGTDAGGLTTETFNTTSFQVADNFQSSAATGMTVAKLIEAKRILRHFHNDLDHEGYCLLIGSQQEADLLNQVQVVSTEFNDRPVLVDGRIKKFLGYDVIVSERLQANATPDRLCVAFMHTGMYLGLWNDLVSRISIRNDLSSEPYDLYTKSSYGVSRTQPGKVVQILSKDSTGSDITP